MTIMAEYKEHLFSCGYETNTIETYYNIARQFYIWHEINIGSEFDALRRSNFLMFKKYLEEVRENVPGSVKVKTHALKCFNDFLIKQNIQPNTIIGKEDNINLYHSGIHIKVPSPEEIDAFILNIKTQDLYKYYVIANLLRLTGIKITECLNLGWTDILPRQLNIKDSEGSLYRQVEITGNMYSELIMIESQKSNYVFCNDKGAPLHRSRVNQVFKKYSDTITPTVLRHFYCKELVLSGEDIETISRKMGNLGEQLVREYIAYWNAGHGEIA